MPRVLPLLATLSPDEQATIIRSLPEPMLRAWVGEFGEWAHHGQSAPPSD